MREVRDLEEQVRPGGGRKTKVGQGTAPRFVPRQAVEPDTAYGWSLFPAP